MAENQDFDLGKTFSKHGKFWFPGSFVPDEQRVQQIRDFPLYDGDVLVTSFPRSGTTWTQLIVWLIMHDSLPDKHNETMLDWFPFLEYPTPGLEKVAAMERPRLIKSHMPYDMLPADVKKPTVKVIYVVRNARDVCVSYYHFRRLNILADGHKYDASFNDYLKIFLDGYVAYGPWPDHISSFWSHRNDGNMLIISYENLQQTPIEVVGKIAEFLGRPLTTARITEIIERTQFNVMREDKSVNNDIKFKDGGFVRKGVAGDWQNHYTPEMVDEIRDKCERPLKLLGIPISENGTFELP